MSNLLIFHHHLIYSQQRDNSEAMINVVIAPPAVSVFYFGAGLIVTV